MPASDAQEAMEGLAKRLAALEVGAAQQVIDAYKPVDQN